MSMRAFINLLHWLTLLILVVIITTCKKDRQIDSKPFGPPKVAFDSVDSKVITVDSTGVQTTILSKGIKYTLTIPKNAIYGLDTSKTVILTPINNIDNLPVAKKFIAAIYFKADSLIFCKPVELKIEFPNALAVDRMVGFAYDNNDESFYRFPILPKNISSTSVTFSFTHFSGYGIATGVDDSQETSDNSKKLSGEKYYLDELAGLLTVAGIMRENIDPVAGKEILLEWFNQIKTPTEYNEIDNYYLQYMAWLHEEQLLFNDDDFKDQNEFVKETLSKLINNEFSHINNEFCDAGTSCEEKKNYLTEVWKVECKAAHIFIVTEPNLHDFCSDAIYRFPLSIMMIESPPSPKWAPARCYCVLQSCNGVIRNADEMVSWDSSDPTSVSLLHYVDPNMFPTFFMSSGMELQLNKTNSSSVITATATFLGCTLSATVTQEVVSPIVSLQQGGYFGAWPKDVYSMQYYAIVQVHPKLIDQLGFASTYTGTNGISWPNGHNSDIQWSSSNGSYMTVDNNGLVTWSGTYGYATITATCEGFYWSQPWESVETSKNGQITQPQIKIINKN